jgi:hypothetical protein
METKFKKGKAVKAQQDGELKVIAKRILKEAKKRAKHEMECLTEFILQEARIAARYAKERPFYIS